MPQYSKSIYRIASELSSDEFIARHRHAPADFTRRNIFTFQRVVGVILASLKRSLQVEIDQYFSLDSLPAGRYARDDAFRMARKKLNWSAFVELNSSILADLPDRFSRWRGMRVIAGDSTTLYLPTTHADTISDSGDGFNCYHTDTGIYSQARGAALCEVSIGMFLRADLASDAVGEREMLLAQLDALEPDDLLVLDRGYPAY